MSNNRLKNQLYKKTLTDRSPRLKVTYLFVGLLQAMAAGAAWAASSGGQILRAFGLTSVLLAILVPLLISLEAGLLAMVIFEPFRGLLRRMQYLVVPYSASEPIHLLTPIGALFAFLIVLYRHKLGIFVATPIAKATSLLALICLAQVFNPLQGGLFVGLSGALFILVPMAWFYFGQHASADLFPRVLRLVVILGLLASAYGVYQMVAGYPAFEQYWIENTDHYQSIAVYKVTRAIATFSNAEEWGRYVELGCLIAVGLAVSRSEGKFRPAWAICAAILAVMIALTGQRTSIFGLFLGLTVFFIAGARSWGSALARVAALAVACGCFLFASSQFAPNESDLKSGESVSTLLSHTTKGTLDPTNETSLGVRLETWSQVLFVTIPSNPLGAGLGDSTLSGTRSDENERRPIDNHFFTLATSAGVPAMLLFIWIFWRSFRNSMRLCNQAERGSKEFATERIAMTLVATLMLNNFFGTTFMIYSIAPLGWLLLGWVSAKSLELPIAVNNTVGHRPYLKRLEPSL